MNKTIIATIVIAAFALPGLALAQSTSRIDKRQDYQDKRIEQGVKSGELNKKEAARMEKGQERVQQMENKAMVDGKVTTKEKVVIEHAQDRQSKRIYRQKNDKQQAKK